MQNEHERERERERGVEHLARRRRRSSSFFPFLHVDKHYKFLTEDNIHVLLSFASVEQTWWVVVA
jgi:predicted dithiol-disulfide oxidoreductase (DUF899 family)